MLPFGKMCVHFSRSKCHEQNREEQVVQSTFLDAEGSSDIWEGHSLYILTWLFDGNSISFLLLALTKWMIKWNNLCSMDDLFHFPKNNVLPFTLDYEPSGLPDLVIWAVEQFEQGN